MNNKIKNVIVLILLVSFAGCGFWENFTTYFNRYFNAVQKFEELDDTEDTDDSSDDEVTED